jgi:uncharacterized iron-regulated membrane protein
MSHSKVFYNLAWRWHFYAGLFVAPFMVLLALTGSSTCSSRSSTR